MLSPIKLEALVREILSQAGLKVASIKAVTEPDHAIHFEHKFLPE